MVEGRRSKVEGVRCKVGRQVERTKNKSPMDDKAERLSEC